MTSWEVEHTDEFAAWFAELAEEEAEQIAHAIDHLAQVGPTCPRPLVDRIKGSRHHNMKELRVSTGACKYRILFIFTSNRKALLLVGGDKSGNWTRWYSDNIPYADDLYDEYLKESGR
jgi:hypothetical protein